MEKGKCPICHQDNHCAMVAGKDPLSCWCMTRKIPEGLADMVPEAQRNQSCICEACVIKYNLEHPNQKEDS
ncbi:MAG: cysteine-rich CWC family protein [Clostridia bacterium]|nr:cysteine-rich CWC family protein [Clostridia bacterium]